jgi:hypothetical protein
VSVHCYAPHPDPRRRGQRCNTEIGDVPSGYVFIATAAKRPAAHNGRIRLQCSRRDCRTWNIFDRSHDVP